MRGAECSSPIPSHLRLNQPKVWSLYQSKMLKSSYFLQLCSNRAPRPRHVRGVIKNLFRKYIWIPLELLHIWPDPQRDLTSLLKKNPSYYHMLANTWNAVENKTIANCFRKAGFTAARRFSELTAKTEEVVDLS
jgi:hypothetical protein